MGVSGKTSWSENGRLRKNAVCGMGKAELILPGGVIAPNAQI